MMHEKTNEELMNAPNLKLYQRYSAVKNPIVVAYWQEYISP